MSAASGYAPCTTPPTHGPRGDPLTSEQPDLDIDALWADYKSAGTRELRDQLIVHYSPLVKYVAGRVGTGLPQNVDQADLVSYGIFGLIDPIEKFEPDRGFKFATYHTSRIPGTTPQPPPHKPWVPP